MKRKVLAITIASLMILLSSCNSNEKSLSDYNTYKIAYIEQNNATNNMVSVEYLYRDINSNKIFETDSNMNIINEYTTNTEADTNTALLELVETDRYTDIPHDTQMIGDYSYYLTLEQSSEYINFMKESGYTIKLKVETAEFIEMILESETGTRRVIITPDILTIEKVDGYTFKINNYIK